MELRSGQIVHFLLESLGKTYLYKIQNFDCVSDNVYFQLEKTRTLVARTHFCVDIRNRTMRFYSKELAVYVSFSLILKRKFGAI